jgi:Tfp pilus assembly protein PilF
MPIVKPGRTPINQPARQHFTASTFEAGRLHSRHYGSRFIPRSQKLHDAETEFRTELAMHPYMAMAHYNLGMVLASQGFMEQAVTEWETTLRYEAHHVDALGELMAYWAHRKDRAKEQYYREKLLNEGARFIDDGNVR